MAAGKKGHPPARRNSANTQQTNLKANTMSNPQFPVNADTMNALVKAFGAFAMTMARNVKPEQRAGMAEDLATLAKHAEKQGDTTLETLLIDIHRAIV
jgi:hypothetical protein